MEEKRLKYYYVEEISTIRKIYDIQADSTGAAVLIVQMLAPDCESRETIKKELTVVEFGIQK